MEFPPNFFEELDKLVQENIFSLPAPLQIELIPPSPEIIPPKRIHNKKYSSRSRNRNHTCFKNLSCRICAARFHHRQSDQDFFRSNNIEITEEYILENKIPIAIKSTATLIEYFDSTYAEER